MYYRLDHADLYDEDDNECSYFFLDSLDEHDFDWPWLHAIKFNNPPTHVIQVAIDFSIEDAAAFCDYAKSSIPMVTERFKAVLDSCGVTNVQYFPVSIKGAEKFDDCPVHYAINIIGEVSVADPDKSVAEKTFNQMGAMFFHELVIRQDLATDLKIFRTAESASEVIISEEIKNACDEAGIESFHYWPLA